MDSWVHKGGIAFSSETPSTPKSSVIVKFEEKPSDEIRNSLKSLGLKWNPLRQEWEGHTNIEELTSLLAPHKAFIKEVDLSTKNKSI